MVLVYNLQSVSEVFGRFGGVDDALDGGERGEWHVGGKRREHEYDGEQGQGMDDAGHRGAAAGAHVGGGTGDRAGGGEAVRCAAPSCSAPPGRGRRRTHPPSRTRRRTRRPVGNYGTAGRSRYNFRNCTASGPVAAAKPTQS